jgi:hypothetical protein
VDAAVRRWAEQAAQKHPGVLRIGYFGSYARGDWGVGSDLDLVVVVQDSPEPFISRAAAWDTTTLPVPADLLVYTQAEWQALDPRARFTRTLHQQAVWVWKGREGRGPG